MLLFLLRHGVVRATLALSAARVWAGALLIGSTLAQAQPTPAPTVTAPSAGQVAASEAGKTTVPARASPVLRPAAATQWAQLTAAQQAALKPLETQWDGLSDAQKRKWLALSRNYANLSPEEQATLHARMTGWVVLSPRERAQARLNFAEVKRLAPSERKTQWEAYQALSEEEKRQLAAKATARPHSAAVVLRPVPAQKLVQLPAASRGQHGARIELAPSSGASGRAPRGAVPEKAAAPATPPAAGAASPAVPGELLVLPPALAVPPVRTTDQPSSTP